MACEVIKDTEIITITNIRRLNAILQGEIWMADLGKRDGSLQSGIRPVIILQNDVGNKYAPTTIIVPLTSQLKNFLPVHAEIGTESGLKKISTSLMEQITTINKTQLIKKIGQLGIDELEAIKDSIIASFKGIL